jgi:hypothetical protein
MRPTARAAAVLAALALTLAAVPWTGDAADLTFLAKHKRKSAKTGKSAKTAKTAKTKPSDFDPRLPILGTRLAQFPAGAGKASADRGCVFCHSVDIVAQQRLTEKQWSAEVTKMTSWGADVPADKREELVAYLFANFGPDSKQYEPVVTRPVGK